MIQLKLDTLGETHISKGNTMLEALENLPVKSDQIKNKGVFTFSDGKNRGQKLLFRKQLKRILANKILLRTWAKNFEVLLAANKQL